MTIQVERDQARCDNLFWSVIFISTIADAAWCFSTIAVNVTSLLIKTHSEIKLSNEKCFWSDIWNVSYIEQRIWNQVSHDHRSYGRNLSNCVEKPEKVRTSTDLKSVLLSNASFTSKYYHSIISIYWLGKSRAFSLRSHFFHHMLIFFVLKCFPWGKCRALIGSSFWSS